MEDKLVALVGFLAKGSPGWHGSVSVGAANVPVEVVRYRALVGVDEPVADAVELIAKIRSNGNHVVDLKRVQKLQMTLRTRVNDDGAITLIAEQNCKFIFVSLLLRKLKEQITLSFTMIREPLRLSLKSTELAFLRELFRF